MKSQRQVLSRRGPFDDNDLNCLTSKEKVNDCISGHLDPNIFRPILANSAVQYIMHFMSVDVTLAKQSLLAHVGYY